MANLYVLFIFMFMLVYIQGCVCVCVCHKFSLLHLKMHLLGPLFP